MTSMVMELGTVTSAVVTSLVAVVRIVFIAQSIVELRGQLGDEGQCEVSFVTHEAHGCCVR